MVELGSSSSAIVLVRHGETTYSNSLPSLTDKGREQVEQTGISLRPLFAEFDRVLLISSPAARAIESMQIVLDTSGRPRPEVGISSAIRPFDIKNLAGFLAYDKQHSTTRYGQMWLTDPYLREENPLIESRLAVENRASRFLARYTRLLAGIAARDLARCLLLVTTHFEIMAPIMKAIYTDKETFPIEIEEGPALGEAMVLYVDNSDNYEYRVSARGKMQPARFNPRTRCFTFLG